MGQKYDYFLGMQGVLIIHSLEARMDMCDPISVGDLLQVDAVM